tara:strand:- start:230 stop:625 length:396 start_codon:yes stop_codon:yes gene_type:complete
MIKLLSITLIILIAIFFIFYKNEYIFNKLKPKKNSLNNSLNKAHKTKLKQVKYNLQNSNLNDQRNFSNFSKNTLRYEMLELFKGSKEDKLKALKIAEFLSDKSTLTLLKLGLKDMDSDIVKLSATLIQKFK